MQIRETLCHAPPRTKLALSELHSMRKSYNAMTPHECALCPSNKLQFSDYGIVSTGTNPLCQRDSLFGPFILATDLVLLLRGEVVLNVKGLPDLLRRLALDHVGDCLTTDIQQSLNIEIVGSLSVLGSRPSSRWRRHIPE